MNKNTQVNAAIIIIGNEILSGRTQDANSITIALWLNPLGVKVQEIRVIPDVEDVIVQTINEVRKKNNKQDFKLNLLPIKGYVLTSHC